MIVLAEIFMDGSYSYSKNPGAFLSYLDHVLHTHLTCCWNIVENIYLNMKKEVKKTSFRDSLQFAKYNIEHQPTITTNGDIHKGDTNLSGHENLGHLPILKSPTFDERTSLELSNFGLYVVIIRKKL